MMVELIRSAYVVIFRSVYYLTICVAAGLVAYAVTRILGG